MAIEQKVYGLRLVDGHNSHVARVQKAGMKEGNNHTLPYARGCYWHSYDPAFSRTALSLLGREFYLCNCTDA